MPGLSASGAGFWGVDCTGVRVATLLMERVAILDVCERMVWLVVEAEESRDGRLPCAVRGIVISRCPGKMRRARKA